MLSNFISCNSNNGITEPNTQLLSSLSGNIQNWVDSTNIKLKLGFPGLQTFYEFGSSSIDENGHFSLDLETPSDSLTSQIVYRFRIDSSMNLDITNPNVKGIDCQLNLISNFHTYPIGRVRYGSEFYNYGEGYFSVSNIYSEGDISIIGADTTLEDSDNFRGNLVVNFNIKLQRGWNPLVFKQLKQINSGNITTYSEVEWSNNTPLNGKWFYKIY